MTFIFITIIAVITIAVLAKQKEIYFVSLAFKNSKSYLSLHIIQILIIYFSLILDDYGNHVFSIFIFLFSVLNCNMKLNSIQIYNFINFFKKDFQGRSII